MIPVNAAIRNMLGSSKNVSATTTATPRPSEGGRVERFLRKTDVLSRTAISRSHLYWLMDRGRFPRSIPLSPRVAVWLESDVDAWIAAQIPSDHPRVDP
ncbi:helix-turn-helix transcriptional regulator [Stenotrophomonas lactitubi]|uniref:helix-turn-helix transcriptional regulator n=1 Tax=Stenotrophomonas lactitubi TaxID=2045214 RepID=UPI0032090EFF